MQLCSLAWALALDQNVTAKITAKAGKKKYTCKVQVNKKKNLGTQTNKSSDADASPTPTIPTDFPTPVPPEKPNPMDYPKIVEDDEYEDYKITYSFDFTIPKDATNEDYDSEMENNYPIMMYIANLKDICPYEEDDEITILSCKIYETEQS